MSKLYTALVLLILHYASAQLAYSVGNRLASGNADFTAYKLPYSILTGTEQQGLDILGVFANGYGEVHVLTSDNKLYQYASDGNNDDVSNLISQAYIPFVNTFRDKIFGPISSLVVMAENVLILAGNGTIYGYGNNAYGELGTGDSTTYNSYPTMAASGLKAKKIAAGEYTAFALGTDNKVYGWGWTESGLLSPNTGPVTTPLVFDPTQFNNKTIIDIIAPATPNGYYTALFLASDGTVFGVGDNSQNQLADGQPLGTTSYYSSPIQVNNSNSSSLYNKNVVQVVSVSGSTFALASDGSVHGWGSNPYCLAGSRDSNYMCNGFPIKLNFTGTPLEGKKVTKLRGGGASIYAFADDGNVYMWGYHVQGNLGYILYGVSDYLCSPTKLIIDGGKPIVNVVPANGVAFVVTDKNVYQTTGDRAFYSRLFTSTAPLGGRCNAVSVAMTYSSTFVVGCNNKVYGWSSSSNLADSPLPTNLHKAGTLLENRSVVKVAASTSVVAVLTTDNQILTFGASVNSYGEYGNSTITAASRIPVMTEAGLLGLTFIDIAVGNNFMVVLSSNGTNLSWGRNNYRQLMSTSTVAYSKTPIVNGLPLLKKIIAGLDVVYAYNETHLYLGGRGSTFLLPGCTTSTCFFYQFNNALIGNKTIGKLAWGYSGSALLLTQSGDLYQWGYSQSLGCNPCQTPVQVNLTALAGRTIVDIASGGRTHYYLTSDGALFVHGENIARGQGDEYVLSTPTRVSSLASIQVKQVAAGYYTALAIADYTSVPTPAPPTTTTTQSPGSKTTTTLAPGATTSAPTPLTCFGLAPDNANVCSGRGKCISFDTCSCTKPIHVGAQCATDLSASAVVVHAFSSAADITSLISSESAATLGSSGQPTVNASSSGTGVTLTTSINPNVLDRKGFMLSGTYTIKSNQVFTAIKFASNSFVGSLIESWVTSSDKKIKLVAAVSQTANGNQYLAIRHNIAGEQKSFSRVSVTVSPGVAYILLITFIPSPPRAVAQLLTQNGAIVGSISYYFTDPAIEAAVDQTYTMGLASSSVVDGVSFSSSFNRAIRQSNGSSISFDVTSTGVQPRSVLGSTETVGAEEGGIVGLLTLGAIAGIIIAVLLGTLCCSAVLITVIVIVVVKKRKRKVGGIELQNQHELQLETR